MKVTYLSRESFISTASCFVKFWTRESNFFNKNITPNKKNIKKIYIDRSDTTLKGSPQRLISNEDEVKKYLLENNFVSVKLHEIKFIEQVDLFYNAECIVGLHGAGFANVVFCKPGTKVVELRSVNAGPVIGNLAKVNDLNYHSIITTAKQIHKVNYQSQQGSIQLPITSLSKVLEN